MKKNKKNNNEEKMENFLDVLIRNYKTVPGVKIVLKLALYFITAIKKAFSGFGGSEQ